MTAQPTPIRPDLPRRPALRPGLRVLVRERDVLQIGLDPARAVRLPATSAVRRTLGVVAERGPLADCDPDVVAVLHRLGVLEAPAQEQPPRVDLRGYGPPFPAALGQALERAGLGPTHDPDPCGGVGLLVGVGEPHREALDDWVAAGVPHLVLRFTEGDAVLGPFVVPGVTACLRCVDAHHADDDPRWPLLVEQHAGQSLHPRRDGVPDPVDPLLAQLAVAWAARDLAAAVRPATWSTTIRLPTDLADFEAISWLRHPGCGCTIDAPPRVMPGGP